MAEEQDVIVLAGSSIFAGFLALLNDVADGDFIRWAGTNLPPIPPSSSDKPWRVTSPGIRVWTPRRPYSTNISRQITTGGSGTTLVYSGGASSAVADSWVYVRVNSTGQGNLRKVSSDDGSTLTVSAAWSPALANNGHVNFLQDSHTISSIDTTKTIITRTSTAAPDFGAGTDGRFVLFFQSDETRKIVSHTADSITLDGAISGTPSAGGGFCILTGVNSCETLTGISPTTCVLQDLTFHVDDTAPVFLTGVDYPNYNSMPFQSPKVIYFESAAAGPGPSINLVPELAFHVRSRLNKPIVVVPLTISSSMVSPFYQSPNTKEPTPNIPFGSFCGWGHDIKSLDFHPSSPESLYTALINAIDSTRQLIEAEGNTMKVRGIFINLSDNDPADSQRTLRLAANISLLCDSLREHIGDSSIPVSISGPSAYGGNDANKEFIYEGLIGIAENNAYTGILDTRTTGYTKAFDGLHFNAAGELKLGQGHFMVWDTVQTMGLSNTEVDICNLALSHVGDKAGVTSLDGSDTSAQARHCIRFYPRAIGLLLEQHSWDFNTRRKPLVVIPHPIANPTSHLTVRTEEWIYAYNLPHLPHHFAKSIAVLPPGAAHDAPTQPYVIESDLIGNKILLTDVQDAILRYTVKVTNPQRFSESFIQAASLLLGSMLAGVIVKGVEGVRLAEALLARYRAAFGQATTHDSNQRQVEPEIEAPWMEIGLPRFDRGGFPLSGA